jgi:two-component system CitB family response regulator/two-component system response regulator DctR
MDEKQKILVIDDDPNIVRLIKFYVGKKYQIESAHNGKQAIDILREKKFDLILVDMFMPQMDGMSFLKELRKKLKLDVLVIMVTAQEPTDQTMKMIVQYAYDIIQKPFTAKRLQLTILNAFKYKLLSDENKQLRKDQI